MDLQHFMGYLVLLNCDASWDKATASKQGAFVTRSRTLTFASTTSRHPRTHLKIQDLRNTKLLQYKAQTSCPSYSLSAASIEEQSNVLPFGKGAILQQSLQWATRSSKKIHRHMKVL